MVTLSDPEGNEFCLLSGSVQAQSAPRDRPPVNFGYWPFVPALLVNGVGMGLFASPNWAGILNSLPPNRRGVGSGMSTTFQNSAMVLSLGIFYSLMVTGLTGSLPHAMVAGLTAHGVTQPQAQVVAALPPASVSFASLLGYNPILSLLGPAVVHHLPAGDASYLTGRSFYPSLISTPFHDDLVVASHAAGGPGPARPPRPWVPPR